MTFGYGRGPAVLDGLDLVIEGGEAVALVGATASGKTTIARLIPRFYDVHAGHVRIDGADVRDVRLSEVRRSVGLVFEDTFLFSDSVRNNIAFADPEAPNEAVVRAASSRAPTSSCASCPRATTRSSVSTATRSPVVSGSASRSRGRSSPTRAS